MLNAAFIFIAPGADPAVNRGVVETPSVRLTSIGVETYEQGVEVAKEMADAGCGAIGGPFLAVRQRLLFAIDSHDETVQRDAFPLHVRQMLFKKINVRIAPRPVQHLHLPRLGQRRHHDAACASEKQQSFHVRLSIFNYF